MVNVTKGAETKRPSSSKRVAVAKLARLRITLWVLMPILLIVSVFGSFFMGASSLSNAEIWGVLTHKLGIFTSSAYPEPSPLRASILMDLRVPRVLMAVFVGAALSVAGVVLQAITRNELAEPYLLGISHGASTGAVISVVVLANSTMSLVTGASLGALASFCCLMLLLRGSGFATTRVVLTGVLVGEFFSAITSLILMAEGSEEEVRGITFWLLGAMGAARWETLWPVIFVSIIAIMLLWMMARYLDALSFGDATAQSMGVPVKQVRGAVLVIVSLLTAACVSAVGAIGFVGLIIPHAVRMIVGSRHLHVIPLSAGVGAIFLVLCDALARVAFAPKELPVGVITAIIGAPVFFIILRRRTKANG